MEALRTRQRMKTVRTKQPMKTLRTRPPMSVQSLATFAMIHDGNDLRAF